MNNKPSMSKRAIRIATGMALVVVMAVVAISLLMTGVGGATAFNAGRADGVARQVPIPAQYTEQCSNGIAVPNPGGNAGLVGDCAALLAAKGVLEGTTGDLNWAADVGISGWDGVTIAGNRVSKLELDSDGLNGEIPAELGNLANLKALSLGGNLTGAIPAELGNFANLEELTLGGNQLTGEIPAELGNLANLKVLGVHDTRLTGAIPAELGDLANLTHLNLSGNQLTGEIPAELGNLANLLFLYLYHNQLMGEIPAELSNLASLRQLLLNSNQLMGEIPAELGNLANLRYLYLSRNQLTGEIPAELGNLANLGQLYLDDNQLTGEIPAELGNLSNIYIWIIGNQFTGCIPQSLRVHLGTEQIQEIGLPICDAATATPTPTATSAPGATATPTPTATSVPRPPATPVATPTPTATPAVSNDVMNRLVALERQVAEIPALKRQIAAMATRIAKIEDGSGATATPIPTPTPTATPASVIEVSPTPTATPSATPTSVAGTSGADACITALAGNASVTGSWSSACLSTNSPNNRTYYARFYTFTLSAASEATITLSSNDAAPYLVLREGEGMSGAIRHETGSYTASAATITMTLSAGIYTIEASTWEAETGGGFTLELEVGR